MVGGVPLDEDVVEAPAMDVPKQHARQLTALAAGTPCRNGHECFRSDSVKLCKSELAAGDKVLFCLDHEGYLCCYGLSFGRSVICLCPVRKYIAQHLRR